MGTTIKNMTGINISSKYFSTPTFLEFFPKHSKPQKNNRAALVYGNNGSGKSTIAHGFRGYKSHDTSEDIKLQFFKENDKIETTDKYNRKNIYIFDEEYISSRVKVKENGLDAIVLFGEQVDLEERINNIEEAISQNEIKIEKLEEDYKIFLDEDSPQSPKYWDKKINNKLKEAGGWAEKGSKIKDQRRNLSVTNSEISRIGNLSVIRTLEELQGKFDEDFIQFTSTDVQSSPIPNKVKLIFITENIVESSKLLLKKNIDKPKLTIREEQLLSLFGIEKATKVKGYVSNKTNLICESCFQPIEDAYREQVLKEIESILNQEIKEFKEELEKLLLTEVTAVNYEEYSKLKSYNNVFKSIDEYNVTINKHNSIIQKKIDDPFTVIEYDIETNAIKDIYEKLNQQLTDLEVERINYNRVIEERSSVEEELLKLNDAIAHHHINDMYSTFKIQEEEKTNLEKEIKEYKQISIDLKNKKIELDSQRKNFQVASGEINKSLKYIFFSEDRLSIDPGTDQLYRIKVNGDFVSPNKVSCGERNALALCYFFTEIAEEMDEKSIYTDEMLLVIDDPISSFDIENRVGITSLLRWKLGQVLESCPHSKVLIMTHDISVLFNLQKALSEISGICGKNSVNAEYRLFQLENKELIEFRYNKHNEYTQLLEKIYQYALGEDVNDILDLSIGNMMRRVLEAFSTFTFKLGISEISLDEKALELLPDEGTKTYYKNLMYRLVLDNESHSMDNVRGVPELGFFSYLSPNEKRQTAKDVLCFIYYLNEAHLISHLPKAKSDLEKWCSK
ncbi:MAG: AAA family ATPase [Bacteroidales bacterium]|nr:AAA family ATPase [Bacteroidales bacterium]